MTPHDVWAAVARCEKDAVRFARKPGGFSDDRIPVLDEDKVRLAVGPTAWDHVNVKQPEDIWAAGVTGLQATPFTDFTPEFYVTGEKAFVLRMDDVDYLINTEGYDYCRYVARLERPKKAAPAPAPPATSETALPRCRTRAVSGADGVRRLGRRHPQ